MPARGVCAKSVIDVNLWISLGRVKDQDLECWRGLLSASALDRLRRAARIGGDSTVTRMDGALVAAADEVAGRVDGLVSDDSGGGRR